MSQKTELALKHRFVGSSRKAGSHRFHHQNTLTFLTRNDRPAHRKIGERYELLLQKPQKI
jgi:hypothetical protein